jgi:AraC-like DNA-binding protein
VTLRELDPGPDDRSPARVLPPLDADTCLWQLILSIRSSRVERPRIRAASAALGMSVRTLQRRLAAHGLTFAGLVDASRREAAACLLVETRAKVIDIALHLGYSDHGHFTRAFRRWTGLTPRAYRRRAERDRVAAPHVQAGVPGVDEVGLATRAPD